MIIKLFTLYVYFQTLLCGCGTDVRRSGFERLRSDYKVKIERIGKLHENIKESSGLAHATDGTFWTHPDGGPDNILQLIDLQGNLLQNIQIAVPNKDWEDLAEDTDGNLFIGDFGNNANTRRDLAVYKLEKASMKVTDSIHFRFKDQTTFDLPYRKRHFDVEAFFYRSDSLFLFTKSRAFKGLTKLYSLSAHSGNYVLSPKEELQVKSPITAADSAPNKKDYALLGYGRLYTFMTDSATVSLNSKRYCLPLGRTGQAEGILYLSPTQLLITNENGKMYRITLDKK
jgi:hypothetical protein